MEPDETQDPAPEAAPVTPPEPPPPPAPPQPSALERIGEFDGSLNMAQARAAAAIMDKISALSPEQAVVLAKSQNPDLFQTEEPKNLAKNPIQTPNPAVSPTRSTPPTAPRQLSPQEAIEKANLDSSRQLIRGSDSMADSERLELAVKAERAYRQRVGLPVTPTN